MPTGTVLFYHFHQGVGLIEKEGGDRGSIPVYFSSVVRAGMRKLWKRQRISYDIETDRGGMNSAVNLRHPPTPSWRLLGSESTFRAWLAPRAHQEE
jgi:cold shock CspA family protein